VGKDPVQIERSIREHRDQIGRQVSQLQDRVQQDLQSMRDKAQEQASHTVEDAKHFLDLDQQMQQHPYTALAGALGLGVVLGMASEGLPGGSANGNTSSYTSRRTDGRSGLGDLMSSVAGVAGSTIQDELRQFVQEGLDSFRTKTRPREDVSNGGNSAPKPEASVQRH
jgi:ElaB/YqjD/DUF883 family membrane-anchored ribosome-binding protein